MNRACAAVLLMIVMAGAQIPPQENCRGVGLNLICDPKPAPKPLNGHYRCEWSNGECKLVATGPIADGWVVEPLDVPAIQETAPGTDPVVLRDPNNCVDGWMENNLVGNHCASRKYWTCADKARILEHDEAIPPKYWCRKVQP